MRPMKSARDPGLDTNAKQVCYPNTHLEDQRSLSNNELKMHLPPSKYGSLKKMNKYRKDK